MGIFCVLQSCIFQGIGFRNWKKRWFVLKGAELVCYKDGGLIETVGLRGCTIKRGKVGRDCYVDQQTEVKHIVYVFIRGRPDSPQAK